jgi:A/G-specific adenine glycosylase
MAKRTEEHVRANLQIISLRDIAANDAKSIGGDGTSVNPARATTIVSKASKRLFRRNLLAWYDAHARDLPWRANRDAYRVWVSEIMLQQTRVAAVIAHFHEFLRRFPNVQKLAAAREDSVLAAWSGLGYYRRARMLHAAAKMVVREHDGQFPGTAEQLMVLPGIGRYTAAAIASIAFGEPVAVVDGNVQRVLQRVSGKRLAGEEFWSTATALLDAKRPGDFNQAMMELGAIVCTPRAPACLACPVVKSCATRGESAVTVRSAPQKKREIHYALGYRDLVYRNLVNRSLGHRNLDYRDEGRPGEVFLVRRARDASLMAGMWELPELIGPRSAGGAAFSLRHSITTTNYTVRVWRDFGAKADHGKWVRLDGLRRVALTGLARKILRQAGLL